MSPSCPVCPNQPLQVIRAKDIEVDMCPACQGLWFDRGELDAFPDRPSTEGLTRHARLNPSRCSRGHTIPRGTMQCHCGAEACRCPRCHQRLSLWASTACVLDLCTRCGGVWLDHGELEALEGVTSLRLRPEANTNKWEIPAPASAFDPWVAPGHREPLHTHQVSPRSPFDCRHCQLQLTVREAFAFDGDIYCRSCRPPGSISGQELPSNPAVMVDRETFRHWGPTWTWGWSALSRIVRRMLE